ncbi:MAG TPA: universal stress protein [Symbiobacteriaceae bacterium]|jgi:nucleotide-binding universal stress UspA family protein
MLSPTPGNSPGIAITIAAMHPQPPQLRHAVLNFVPATAICDFARRLGARMIIVGTRGESLQKLLLGSVSRAILESAPCPVLVVP